MREIIFRGKRKDNGEWVYGSLIKRDLGCFIVDESNNSSLRFCSESVFAFDCVLVIPETVGQYTGLTDKNGKKIFEGDILSTRFGIGVVKYINGIFFVILTESGKECRTTVYSVCSNGIIIGNIHDNSELLKGGVDNG
jgi:uncharacterized phage protein (TIGR01671 family)